MGGVILSPCMFINVCIPPHTPDCLSRYRILGSQEVSSLRALNTPFCSCSPITWLQRCLRLFLFLIPWMGLVFCFLEACRILSLFQCSESSHKDVPGCKSVFISFARFAGPFSLAAHALRVCSYFVDFLLSNFCAVFFETSVI